MTSILHRVKRHPHMVHYFKYKIAYMLGVLFIGLTYFYFQMSNAGIESRNIELAAVVVPNCIIDSMPTQINFGVFKTPYFNHTDVEDASTAFTVRCTKGVTSTITINRGEHVIGAHRDMFNKAGGYLAYELYTNSNKSVAWTENMAVNYTWESATPYSMIIYAYLPAGEDVQSGGYQDKIIVTVRFYPFDSVQTFSVLVTIVFLPKDVLDIEHLALNQ